MKAGHNCKTFVLPEASHIKGSQRYFTQTYSAVKLHYTVALLIRSDSHSFHSTMQICFCDTGFGLYRFEHICHIYDIIKFTTSILWVRWLNVDTLNKFYFTLKLLLTIIRVQDLHYSEFWKFKSSHHWLRENNLEWLWHFILAIWQDTDPPGSSGLARVELNLLLRFPSEIFVLFCSAILRANT